MSQWVVSDWIYEIILGAGGYIKVASDLNMCETVWSTYKLYNKMENSSYFQYYVVMS